MQSPQSLQTQPKWKRVIEEYRQEPTFDNVIEILFKVKKRESTVRTEVYCGFIHFLSVCTCLAINPSQLSFAGYEKETTATSTALACAVTCFLTGFFGNLPFVCTPILATSIYFSVFMKSYDVSLGSGNVVSLLVGVALMLCGIRRVINFSSRLIPDSIRVGICVGVSLLIALQALVRLNLVVQGTDTILKLGSIWEPQVMISILAFILIGVLHHFSVRGSYVCGLVFGSFSFWLIYNSWPKEVFAPPRLIFDMDFSSLNNLKTWELFLDIFIISSVLLAGLSSSLSSLARLEITSGIPPRRRWLYLSCGIGTIVGAAFGTGPLLISPESIPAIVAGAKTGLSTVVCGFCFIISVFMYPLWASVPEAGTGPVILMIGVLLFENTARVNWLSTKDSIVVYITAIFSAFTFSIFHGVVFGLAINAIIVLLTGEFTNSLKHIFPNISDYFCLRTDDLSTHSVDPDKDTVRLASNEHSTTDFDAINKRRYGSVGDENDQNGAFMYHCEEQMVVTTKEDLYAVQLSRVVQLQSLQDVLGTSSNSGKVNIHNNSIHGTGGVTSPKIKQTIPTVDGYDSETRNCLLDEVQIGIEEQRFDDDNNISFKKEYNSISHRSKSLDV